MKQHISIDQFNKLSEKGKEKLRKWWKPEPGDLYWDEGFFSKPILVWSKATDEEFLRLAYPCPSIGQMIEFLDEDFRKMPKRLNAEYMTLTIGGLSNNEICDALWEAVKDVLEKE